MKHYDLRVIEDCLVYSYEVETPIMPAKAVESAERASYPVKKKEKQMFSLAKLFRNVFLILLMPFALLIDAMTACARYSASAGVTVFRSTRKYMPALGTLSCFILASAIFYYI